MKIHYFFKEIAVFSAVFVFLLMPSLFQSAPAEGTFCTWNFPLEQLVFMAFSFVFVFFETNIYSLKSFVFQSFSKNKLKRELIIFVLGIIALFACSSFFQFAASFFSDSLPKVDFVHPESLKKWIFCILSFFAGAILEENIFRIYLPSFFRKIFERSFESGFFSLIPEFFPCIIFSLCHRYLGIFAVLNAFSAHIILRFVFYKKSSPILNYSIHFVYNILNVLLMFFIVE